MAYTKPTITAASRVSEQLLNTYETQYDEVMGLESTWNDHTARYYLKTEAIVKFFNPSYMGSGSGADADLLDGHHVSDLVGTGLPVGAIVWWAKDPAVTIPAGWSVCNGSNGTADLRDKFVVGASASLVLNSTYGAASVTPTSASVSIGTTTLTTTTMPAHTHTWTETHAALGVAKYSYVYLGSQVYYTSGSSAKTTDSTGSGSAHGHAGSTVTFNSQSNIPPYIGVYLIQRIW